MCQLIVKPAGVKITRSVLHDAWCANDDGAGFAYRNEVGEVLLAKGYFKFKQFWKAYEKVSHLDTLIHFRLATHGQKTVENCHPFVVAPQVVMGHNGILSAFQPYGSDTRSDTRIFCDTIITPALQAAKLAPDAFLGEWSTKVLLETWTRGNKLAFLTPGGFHIINEHLGEWKNKVWYSSGYPPENKWMCGLSDWNWRGSLGLKTCVDKAVEKYNERWGDDVRKLPVVVERKWERCEVCSDEVPRLYSLGGDRICYTCWETFAN